MITAQNKYTSFQQHKLFVSLKKYMIKQLEKQDYKLFVNNNSELCMMRGNFSVILEEEQRAERKHIDILMTITNHDTEHKQFICIEYDGYKYHRKKTDYKRDAELMAKGYSLIHVQTAKQQPEMPTLWEHIKTVVRSTKPRSIYYPLSDFDADVWTGKKFMKFNYISKHRFILKADRLS